VTFASYAVSPRPRKIREHYGYSDMTEPLVGFRLTRWLYGLCWTGTERPSKLFERATAWLLAHKILLPGCIRSVACRARSRDCLRAPSANS
jgi:Domain of unknown function (DUF4158)